jgi:hypothetical protein
MLRLLQNGSLLVVADDAQHRSLEARVTVRGGKREKLINWEKMVRPSFTPHFCHHNQTEFQASRN